MTGLLLSNSPKYILIIPVLILLHDSTPDMSYSMGDVSWKGPDLMSHINLIHEIYKYSSLYFSKIAGC